jgi:hypothetical protein
MNSPSLDPEVLAPESVRAELGQRLAAMVGE